MLFYRASLDVSRDLAQAVARLLSVHRGRIGTRRGRRSLGCFAQAVLLLRFKRQRTAVADLARDNAASLKTAYRYLPEALDVLAAQAADLPEVVAEAVNKGTEHLLLDGTLMETDRVHDRGSRRDRCTPEGTVTTAVSCRSSPMPMGGRGGTSRAERGGGVSPVEPGCTHDLTAACLHALPALYAAARHGVPTLADEAYIGAGAGIRVSARRPRGAAQVSDRSTQGWNSYVNSARAFVEHGIAHLKTCWRILRHVSLCPWRISTIVATALVLSWLANRY
ncbi:transposase family protein [Kineococcus sp. SYSU DK004]|uniref:transposase family protein n=1 Tax=Kineococcus sp. SYSU DK004 TaxID=3383125 RepID=UPI003D7D3658